MITAISRKGSRGQALILTAFFVFVLFTLALAYFKLLPMELNSALKTKQTISSQLVAESGVREATIWLQSQPAHRIITQSVLDLEFNASVAAAPVDLQNNWSYQVRIDVNNDGPFLYDITSTALFVDKPQRQARATVTRENFAGYALFIDRWGGDLRYVMRPDFVQGPFHTNDHFRLAGSGEEFWDDPDGSFVSGNRARMTFARGLTGDTPLGWTGDGNAYFGVGTTEGPALPNNNEDHVPYNEDGAISSRYNKMVEGGRSNLRSVEHVPLPYSSATLRFTALDMGGDAPPFVPPSDIGVYLPGTDTEVTGGIFIVGSAEIGLNLTPGGHQLHNITQIIPDEAYLFDQPVVQQRPILGDVWQPGPITVPIYESGQVRVTRQRQIGTNVVVETVTRQRQVGVRIENVGGMTREVPVFESYTETVEREVPIFEEYEDFEQGTVIVGYENIEEGRMVRGIVGYEDYDTIQQIYIEPEVYEANPDAYPGALLVNLPGGPKTAQIIEVTEGSHTLDGVTATAGQTLFKNYDGDVTVLDGNLNGVTYVDGDVRLHAGVTKGALSPNSSTGDPVYEGRYVIANPDASRTLSITGDQLAFYDGTNSDLREPGLPNVLKRGETHPTGEHGLGLIAQDVYIDPATTAPLDVHAVILAGRGLLLPNGEPNLDSQERPRVVGGFGASSGLLSSGRLQNFRLVGGLIQANAYLWNEGHGTNGSQGMTGPLVYDQMVADSLIRFPMTPTIVTLRYADRFLTQAAYDTESP